MHRVEISSRKQRAALIAVQLAGLLFLLPICLPFLGAVTCLPVASSTEENSTSTPIDGKEKACEEGSFSDWIKATGRARRRCASLPILRARPGQWTIADIRAHRPLASSGPPVLSGRPEAPVPLRC